MDRIIMVVALLFVFGSAACRTPEQQTEETRPPVEVGSLEVIPSIPTEKVRPSVEVGPLKGKDEGSSESDGEVRLAALERRLAALERHVAAMRERVARLQAKSQLPRLEQASGNLDGALADFDGALEMLAPPKPSAEEER